MLLVIPLWSDVKTSSQWAMPKGCEFARVAIEKLSICGLHQCSKEVEEGWRFARLVARLWTNRQRTVRVEQPGRIGNDKCVWKVRDEANGEERWLIEVLTIWSRARYPMLRRRIKNVKFPLTEGQVARPPRATLRASPRRATECPSWSFAEWLVWFVPGHVPYLGMK